MRVAVIADIHGNLPALEAVLAEVERQRPDRLVVAGDVVDGAPDSAACWERVKALRCPILRGNHERYVFDFSTERAAPEWAEARFGPLHFAREELSVAQRAELAALPTRWESAECPGLLVVHASPRSDADSVHAHTDERAVAAMFAGVPATTNCVVRAHNHLCAIRFWAGGTIVTSGAVGLPLEGTPTAHFVLLELRRDGTWRPQHQAVRYDVAQTLRRFRDSGYLERTGPVGRLFYREVATGTHQVTPFLRFYENWQRERGEASGIASDLDAALAAFLGEPTVAR